MTPHPAEMLLTDQVAIVTGGGAGIGQGIASGLAAFGADLVIADIDPDRAAVSARMVEAEGRRALVVQTDVSDPAAVAAMVNQGFDHFGRLDILVNNAGGVRPGPFLGQDERSWRRHVDINLISLFAATAAAAPIMIAGGRGGAILNIASIEAMRAAPDYAVYAACKAGMVNFTRTMALELAEHRIRINALAPDIIASPGIRGIVRGPVPDPLPQPAPSTRVGLGRYIPLGREGDPGDVASAAVFLCSPMASYVTGVCLGIDGGTRASAGWTRSPSGKGWQLFDDAVLFP